MKNQQEIENFIELAYIGQKRNINRLAEKD